MKNYYKLALIALLVIGASISQANAQETAEATATANATIIAPIQIAQAADMHFGNIVATSSGGTVVLGTDDSRTESGVQLPATTGTVNAASFTVTGEGSYTFDITLPADGYEIKTGGGTAPETMTIGTWVHNAGASPALSAGSATVKVGATLTSVADQTAGTYIGATPFTVSVNYN